MTGIIFDTFTGNHGDGLAYAPRFKARGFPGTNGSIHHNFGAGIAPRPAGAGKASNTGHGHGFAPKVKGFGTPEMIEALGAGYAPRFASSGFDADLSVSVNFGYGNAPRPKGAGSGQVLNPGFGTGYVARPWCRAYGEGTGHAPFGVGLAPAFHAFGLRGLFYQGIVTIQESPGFVELAYVDEPGVMRLGDWFSAAPSTSMQLGLVFAEIVNIAANTRYPGTRKMSITQPLLLEDVFTLINQMVLAESITLSAVQDVVLHKLLALADMLMVQDQVIDRREALMTIVATLYLADQMKAGYVVAFNDEIALTALADPKIQALLAILESLDVTSQLTMRLHALMHASDSVHLTDMLTAARAARMGLIEQIVLGGVFRFEGLDYQIYAMTTVGAAVSEYRGWQFNSMFTVDGITYGADDTGIHVLEGDDDNGDPIEASLRLGLSTLGTSLYKAVPNVYIGYNGAGQMLLKAVTTERGVKKENWYKLVPIARGSDANARFDVSKGLHSVYWDFELANIDGEYFELDFVEVWRMALTRRKK